MATLADLASTVGDMLARTDLATQIKREIGHAVERYNRKTSHLTETRDVELTTAIGVNWYGTVSLSNAVSEAGETTASLPVSRITGVQYARRASGGSFRERLRQLHYSDFENLLEGPDAGGDPLSFTLHAAQIGLWPSPSEVQVISFSAHVKPNVPSADSDTSAWFDAAREMIECSAAAAVLAKYLQDEQRATIYASMEAARWNEFHEETVKKAATGRLRSRE